MVVVTVQNHDLLDLRVFKRLSACQNREILRWLAQPHHVISLLCSPMPQEQLKQTLAELKTQLAVDEDLDEETEALLQQLADNINEVLIREQAREAGEQPPEKQSTLDQLLDLTERFEESHPDLASAIGRVASALSRIGI